MSITRAPHILLLEPSWDAHVHLPANLGFLRTVKSAYPEGAIGFVGGAAQITMMQESVPDDALRGVSFYSWDTALDKDTMPIDVYRTYKRIQSLPSHLVREANRIFLTSCTATSLTALTILGAGKRIAAVLHGNANELTGWRSRNPIRRALDLTASLKRVCRQGGNAIVMENRIQKQLGSSLPWLASHLHCIPHPILPEETSRPDVSKELTLPIKIGLIGTATHAKGFPEFLHLAKEVDRTKPGQFEFHAIGNLPAESRGLDQSRLKTKAERPLPRDVFLQQIKQLHFVFTWPSDSYYLNAASGVFYDAMNLGIPMITRNLDVSADPNISNNEHNWRYSNLDQAIDDLCKLDITTVQQEYTKALAVLSAARQRHSLDELALQIRHSFPLSTGIPRES